MVRQGSNAVIAFPLQGEWTAIHTPVERVPSHGTDEFGQRYAFDFARFDSSADKFYSEPIRRHLLGRLPVEAFHCWGAPVFSAFAGRVVGVGDGWPDRRRVNAAVEVVRATLFPPAPKADDFRPRTGNFVLVEGEPGVALYAHLQQGSLRVGDGDAVAQGDPLGRVGNSGNSTMPHLHFQLMDGRDPFTAAGRLCAFAEYERRVGSEWRHVERGIPGPLERIRSRSTIPPPGE